MPSVDRNSTFPDILIQDNKMAMVFRKTHPKGKGDVTFMVQAEYEGDSTKKRSKSPPAKKMGRTESLVF